MMSRAPGVAADCSLIAAQYEAAPGTETLRALRETFGMATPGAVREIIEEAAKFADRYLAPLNSIADTEGCHIDGGRVRTASGHRQAWAAFVDASWPALDQPMEFGGQDLPLALATAVHGSPTCALGFENAKAWLIGIEGRGLSQMFVMIANMRLAVGTQGLSVASGAADAALAYARDRRQGGPADAPPRPIIEHADVQRLLLGMLARIEMLRGLAFAIANQVDLAHYLPEESARQDAAALVSWLLPLFKTFGGDTAFEVSSDSIQVLGGAGYTRDWPIEQALRDARVFTIYEGTTGIQGLDLLHRRLWREKGRGLNLFLSAARADAAACRRPEALRALRCLDLLEDAASSLSGMEGMPREAQAGASAFLQLAILAATAWIAVRLAALGGADDASRRLAGSACYWLSDVTARAELQHALALTGASRLSLIGEIIPVPIMFPEGERLE